METESRMVIASPDGRENGDMLVKGYSYSYKMTVLEV